jgi:hypothetical protein
MAETTSYGPRRVPGPIDMVTVCADYTRLNALKILPSDLRLRVAERANSDRSSQFFGQFHGHGVRSSHSSVTMRLTGRQRVRFGEKLLELANYAVTALIFGQLVGQARISSLLTMLGLGIYVALVLVGLWLAGGK